MASTSSMLSEQHCYGNRGIAMVIGHCYIWLVTPRLTGFCTYKWNHQSDNGPYINFLLHSSTQYNPATMYSVIYEHSKWYVILHVWYNKCIVWAHRSRWIDKALGHCTPQTYTFRHCTLVSRSIHLPQWCGSLRLQTNLSKWLIAFKWHTQHHIYIHTRAHTHTPRVHRHGEREQSNNVSMYSISTSFLPAVSQLHHRHTLMVIAALPQFALSYFHECHPWQVAGWQMHKESSIHCCRCHLLQPPLHNALHTTLSKLHTIIRWTLH